MPTWVPVCGVDDIDEEDVIPFAHDDVDYAVYRSPDDQYFATAGHCTHELTLLCDGLVMGSIVECPKHNGRFDYRDGSPQGAPAIVGLQTYPTMIESGTVYIDVD